jgi:hypothetical protein
LIEIYQLYDILSKNSKDIKLFEKKYNIKKNLEYNSKFSNILNFDSNILKKIFNIEYKNYDKFYDNNLSRNIFINKQVNLGYKYYIKNFILKYLEIEEIEYKSGKIDIDTQLQLSQENIQKQKEKLLKLSNNCNKIKISYHFTSLNDLNNKIDIENGVYSMLHLNNFKKIYKRINNKWENINIITSSNALSLCNPNIHSIYDEFKKNSCVYDKYDKLCIETEHLKIKNTINLLEKQIDILKHIIRFLKLDINENLILRNKYIRYLEILDKSILYDNLSFNINYKTKDNRNFIGSKDLIDYEDQNMNIENYENSGVQVILFNEKKIDIKDDEMENNLIILDNILLYTGLNYKLNLYNKDKIVLIEILPKFINIIWDNIKEIIKKDYKKKKLTLNYETKIKEQKKKFTSNIQKHLIISALLIIIFQNNKNTIKITKNEYNNKYIHFYSLENEKNLIKYFSFILLENLPESELKEYDKNFMENIDKHIIKYLLIIRDSKSFYINLLKKEKIDSQLINNIWESYKPKLLNYNLNTKSIISKYISTINLLIKEKLNNSFINERDLLQFCDYMKIELNINFYNTFNISQIIKDGINNLNILNSTNIYELLILYKTNLIIHTSNFNVIFEGNNIHNLKTLYGLLEIDNNRDLNIISKNEYLNKYSFNLIELISTDNEKEWGSIIQYNYNILNNLSKNINLDNTIINNLNNYIANPNNIGKEISEIDKINNELLNFFIYDLKEIINQNIIIKTNIASAINQQNFDEYQYKIINNIINKSKNSLIIDKDILLNENDEIYLKINKLTNTLINYELLLKLFNNTTNGTINSSIKQMYIMLYIILIFIIELYLIINNENSINLNSMKIFDEIYELPFNKNVKLIENICEIILNKLNNKIVLNTRTSEELQRGFETLRENSKKSQLDIMNKLTDDERTMYMQNKKILGIKTLDFLDDSDETYDTKLYEDKKDAKFETLAFSKDDDNDNDYDDGLTSYND